MARTSLIVSSLLLAALVLLAFSPGGPPPPARLSPGLARRAIEQPGARTLAWVFFTDKGLNAAETARALRTVERGLDAHARARRAPLGANLGLDALDLPVHAPYVDQLRARGFTVRRVSRWLNAASIEAPAVKLTQLEGLGFVRRITPVLARRGPIEPLVGDAREAAKTGVMSAAQAPSDSLEHLFYGPSYNQLDQLQVLAMHRMGYSGAGVRVLMLDTGYKKDHPVFACARVIAEYDFVMEDGNTQNEGADNVNQHNHGTGTWATLGGYGPKALIGPAFAAEFVLAKTEDIVHEVHAEEDNYIAALEWGDTLGVDVASASLGYWDFDDSTSYTLADLDGDTAPITIAVDIAVAKGMCVVNAAGNAGPNPSTIGSPADADSVISVGAVDSLGVIQAFSSRGPTADGRIKPEVCARGRNTYWAQAWTNAYGPANGTSLATPLVGGLAALLKEAHPDWPGETIREALMGTATRTGTPDNAYGYGIAQGVSAMTHNGATPAPARMTLPFALLAPADGAVVNSVAPTLRWGASDPASPGDVASYRVIVSASATFAAPDTFSAGPDTTLHLPVVLTPGSTTWWKVEAIGNQEYVRRSMNVHAFTVNSTVAVLPGDGVEAPAYALHAARPNPMRARTMIPYRAPVGARFSLDIFDVTGRVVRRFDLIGAGGVATVTWDGRDSAGREVAAGAYFYRLPAHQPAGAGRLIRLP